MRVTYCQLNIPNRDRYFVKLALHKFINELKFIKNNKQ